VLSLFSNPHIESKTFYDALSIKKYIEFGKSHSAYLPILELASTIDNDENFRNSVKSMLTRSIKVLALLTPWLIQRLEQANIKTIEDLYNKSEADLFSQIYGVGPARARTIKNAVSAELLEYLSG
jgi:DNA-directed RNA polymerase alpha subunit